jgi:Calx-beta domain-containing protein
VPRFISKIVGITLACTALACPALAQADPVIEITKRLGWDVVGLDSNDVSTGADTYPIGYRACNTGDAPATNVQGLLTWTSANQYIDLPTGIPATTLAGDLGPDECYDFYYNIKLARTDSAYNTAREYQIAITADGGLSATTPIDATDYNELYVEKLVSQSRNSIKSITGPATVYRGGTYQFVLKGSTAPGGYEQLESFIDFPNNIFRIVSVAATYSTGITGDSIYLDNCGWEHDPKSTNYFTKQNSNPCATKNKEGGDIQLTYTVEIIGVGDATVSAMIYDFSGSSFHYNADYGTDVLAISAQEPPPVVLTIADASITEGGSLSFGLSLNLAQSVDTTVTFNPTGVTASATDFTDANVQVTIPAGQTTGSVIIPTTPDLIDELNETLTLSVASIDAGTVDSFNAATGTITDDDAAPSLVIGDTFVSEGGLLSFSVSLSNPSSVAVNISLMAENGTASSLDYTAGLYAANFPPGATATTVSVPTSNDAIDEADETVVLRYDSHSGGPLGDVTDTGTGDILDNDGSPSVTIADASISEGGNLAFLVGLSNPSSGNITLTLTPSDITAESADYQTAPVHITIPAGSTATTVNIPTTQDTMDESDETISLSVSSIDLGVVGSTSDTGTGTIVDNDGAPNITIGDASSTEGSAISFPVSLSNPSSTDITLTFTLVNGTASSSDYTTTDVQISIPAGQTAASVVIPTTGDAIDESNETFSVSVGSVDAGTVGDTSDTATGTINDDDGAPGVTIGDASISEGGVLVFPIGLTNPSASPITLSISKNDGTAGSGDYDNSTVLVTIPAGATAASVSVSTVNDSIDESDETMSVLIDSVVSGTAGDITDTGAGTILDNDGAPSLSINDASVSEGGSLAFLVNLSNPSAQAITVTFQPSTGTAGTGDYDTSNVQLTFPAGATSTTVNIPTTDDSIDESDETMSLAVSSVDAGTLGDTSDTATGLITDNDGAPNIVISDASTTEGGTIGFPVNLSNPSATAITLTFVLANGTAGSTDYTVAPVQITIPPGQTRATVNVPTTPDLIDESNETITVSVGSVDAGSVNDTSDTATGTINDDDGAPSITIGDAAIAEGGSLAFDISLSNPSATAITLTLAKSDGTADSSDYDSSALQITFPPGQTSVTANVATTDDTVDESDENMTLSVLSIDSGSVGDSTDTGAGTINDNDGAPSVDIGDASITEGGNLSFPLALSNASSVDTTITFSLATGTAGAGDFDTGNVQVTILANQTVASIIVPTTDDAIDESDETMSVAVLSVDSGSLGDTTDTATGTITDDDGAPGLTIDDATITEGGTLGFAITLSNPSAEPITVTFASTPGTAVAADYDTASVQITIPPGQTDATVNIPTTDDSIDESDESFGLAVASVDNGTVGDTTDTASGTIVDNDGAPSLVIDDATITEAGILVFDLSLSNVSATDTIITFQTTPVTADAADYDTANIQVTIPAGQTAGSVSVQTTDDALDESDETITIAVVSVDSGALGDTSDTAMGTITDDDGAPSLTIDDATITEGGDLSFVVTLSNESTTDTTFTLLPAVATAGVGDFDPSPVQVTIRTGDTIGTATVATTSDSIDESDETMSLSVLSVDAGTLGDISDTGEGTIVDDDGAPSLTIDDATTREGDNLVFPLTLSNSSSTATTVTFVLSPGTADASDYDPTAVQVTIPAGQVDGSVSIPTTDDTDREPAEDMTIAVGSVDSGALGDSSDTATGTITDNDSGPNLKINNATIEEGGVIVFSVTLDSPALTDIDITLMLSKGTAGTADFVSADINIIIAAGATKGVVRVQTSRDTIIEPPETFSIAVRSVRSGVLGDYSDTGVGTITDSAPTSVHQVQQVPTMNPYFLMLLSVLVTGAARRYQRR